MSRNTFRARNATAGVLGRLVTSQPERWLTNRQISNTVAIWESTRGCCLLFILGVAAQGQHTDHTRQFSSGVV